MSAIAWCPKNPFDDKEVEDACKTVNCLSDSPQIKYGTISKPLSSSSLSANENLYVIFHGHPALPVFSIGASHWTPSQMANMIQLAGLSKDHRQIVMLVCHAGRSVGGKAEVSRRWSLNAWAKATKNKIGGATKIEEGQIKEFTDAMKAAKPQVFNSNDQVLPMSAQFIDELKKRGYQKIRVKAFQGKVEADFTRGIHVHDSSRNTWSPASGSNTVSWL